MITDQKFYKAAVGTMVSNGINKFRFTTPVVRVRNLELVELLANSTSAEEITREEAFELMPDMYREVEFEEKKAEELKRAEAERLAAIEAEKADGESSEGEGAGGSDEGDQRSENEDDDNEDSEPTDETGGENDEDETDDEEVEGGEGEEVDPLAGMDEEGEGEGEGENAPTEPTDPPKKQRGRPKNNS